ncbi:MAG: transketolase family protein [Desulfurella sp.]|jgi:transketolase
MKTMREAFGLVLVELAKKRDDFVVLDADVAGGTGVSIFRDKFPKRYIQCGIAEQNMVSLAAGLTSAGLIPIVTAYAIFLSMRAIEQIRNSVAYPNFNVKIVASHLGLDVGPDGPTHQAIEDLAILRAIPNMKVVAPADPFELKKVMEVILENYGPIYVRTGRSPIPEIFNDNIEFELGKAKVIRDGSDVSIIAVGVMVHRALEAAEILSTKNISAQVINVSTIKPIDKNLIIESAKKTKCIVTAEDHNIFGGLFGAISEVLAVNYPTYIEPVALNDQFAESGDPIELSKKYHLDSISIADAAQKVLKKRLGL